MFVYKGYRIDVVYLIGAIASVHSMVNLLRTTV